MLKLSYLKLIVLLFVLGVFMSYAVCQEEATVTTTVAPKEEEEEEEPAKKGCSIWCWIQKIAMFVISQLLSGD